MPNTLYIGMDGGGTSTRAVVATASGEVVGVGRAGGSNPNSVGEAGSIVSLQVAADNALMHAKARKQDVAAVFIGLAGVVDEADHAQARRIAAAAGLAEAGIHHDIHVALMGGLVGQPGIALIAGTGSSCYGINAAGESCQTGGFGTILDDGGSAYGLGLGALRVAVRVADGRIGASTLQRKVLDHLGLTEIRGIVQRVYQRNMSKSEIAAMAPMSLASWHEGDAAAKELVREQAGELALIVTTAARRLGLASPDVIYAGSVLENSGAYRELVAELIREVLPGARVLAPRLPPVLGALLLALDGGGVRHDAAAHERMLATYGAMIAE